MPPIFLSTTVGWDVLREHHDRILKRGDVVHIRGKTLLSKLIRVMQRGPNEDLSWASHTAIVYSTVADVKILEAGLQTELTSIFDYEGKAEVVIMSISNINEHDRKSICVHAEPYIGREYGWGKLIAHALDWALGSVYFFRRLLFMEKYPICSWIVAWAYKKALHYEFGVPPNAAQPDDILDHCLSARTKKGDVRWFNAWCSSHDTLIAMNLRPTVNPNARAESLK